MQPFLTPAHPMLRPYMCRSFTTHTLLTHASQHPDEADLAKIIVTIVQIRKLRHSEGRDFSHVTQGVSTRAAVPRHALSLRLCSLWPLSPGACTADPNRPPPGGSSLGERRHWVISKPTVPAAVRTHRGRVMDNPEGEEHMATVLRSRSSF